MGVFDLPDLDGSTPNTRPYELIYAGGLPYVLRSPGDDPVRYFSLASAVSLANWLAEDGDVVSVVDPETKTVLWTGERAMR
jgi:hypothetical protein